MQWYKLFLYATDLLNPLLRKSSLQNAKPSLNGTVGAPTIATPNGVPTSAHPTHIAPPTSPSTNPEEANGNRSVHDTISTTDSVRDPENTIQVNHASSQIHPTSSISNASGPLRPDAGLPGISSGGSAVSASAGIQTVTERGRNASGRSGEEGGRGRARHSSGPSGDDPQRKRRRYVSSASVALSRTHLHKVFHIFFLSWR